MARKNSNVAHRAHVEEVAKRLLRFEQPWRIKAELCPAWDLTESMLDKILAQATKLIVETVSDFDEEYKKHIARGHAIIAECIKAGDYKTASTMFANLSRLGLEKTSVDHTSGGVPLISFSFAPTVPQALPESTLEAQAVEIQVISPDLCSPNETAKVIKAPELLKNEPTDDHPDAS